jgi:hypothetical protein
VAKSKDVLFRGQMMSRQAVAHAMGYSKRTVDSRIRQGVPLDRPVDERCRRGRGWTKQLTDSGVHEIDGLMFDDELSYSEDIEARVVVTMFRTQSRDSIYRRAGCDQRDRPNQPTSGDDGRLLTQEEVARLMDLSRQRVDQIEKSGLAKLQRKRRIPMFKVLRELMELRDEMRTPHPWDVAKQDSIGHGELGYSKYNEQHSMASIARRCGKVYEPRLALFVGKSDSKGGV